MIKSKRTKRDTDVKDKAEWKSGDVDASLSGEVEVYDHVLPRPMGWVEIGPKSGTVVGRGA